MFFFDFSYKFKLYIKQKYKPSARGSEAITAGTGWFKLDTTYF